MGGMGERWGGGWGMLVVGGVEKGGVEGKDGEGKGGKYGVVEEVGEELRKGKGWMIWGEVLGVKKGEGCWRGEGKGWRWLWSVNRWKWG